jgi:hypothetical protein
MKYMKYNFNATIQEKGMLDSMVSTKKDIFCYLGLMLQKNRDIDEDVSHTSMISVLPHKRREMLD